MHGSHRDYMYVYIAKYESDIKSLNLSTVWLANLIKQINNQHGKVLAANDKRVWLRQIRVNQCGNYEPTYGNHQKKESR